MLRIRPRFSGAVGAIVFVAFLWLGATGAASAPSHSPGVAVATAPPLVDRQLAELGPRSPAAVAPSVAVPAGIVIVGFQSAPTSGVAPFTVTFTLNLSHTPLLPTTYNVTWQFADGTSNVLTSVSSGPSGLANASMGHLYTAVGTFNASVSVTDNRSADSLVNSPKRTVVSETVLRIGFNTSANPLTLGSTFGSVVLPSGGLPPYTEVWLATPAGCSASGANLTCVPPAAGPYYPHVQVTDSKGQRKNAYDNFTVNAALTVRPTEASYFSCNGTIGTLQENFSAVPSGGTSPFSYTWSYGDGTPNGTAEFVQHQFSLGPTYKVLLVVADSGGAKITANLNVTTAYPACQSSPPPKYTPPIVLLQGGIIAILVAVIVLAVLLIRRPKPKVPVSSWNPGPTASSGTPGPTTGAPPPKGP